MFFFSLEGDANETWILWDRGRCSKHCKDCKDFTTTQGPCDAIKANSEAEATTSWTNSGEAGGQTRERGGR